MRVLADILRASSVESEEQERKRIQIEREEALKVAPYMQLCRCADEPGFLGQETPRMAESKELAVTRTV